MILLCIICQARLLKAGYFLPILCCLKHAHACVWKRERESNIVSRQCPFKLLPSPPRHAADSTARRQLACVTNESEKEDYIETLLGLAGSFTENYEDLKDIIVFRLVFIFRKQVFWIFAQCGWVTDSQRFEVTYLLRLEGYGSVNWFMIL
jgi:hypothetical protein